MLCTSAFEFEKKLKLKKSPRESPLQIFDELCVAVAAVAFGLIVIRIYFGPSHCALPCVPVCSVLCSLSGQNLATCSDKIFSQAECNYYTETVCICGGLYYQCGLTDCDCTTTTWVAATGLATVISKSVNWLCSSGAVRSAVHCVLI